MKTLLIVFGAVCAVAVYLWVAIKTGKFMGFLSPPEFDPIDEDCPIYIDENGEYHYKW